MIQEQKHYYAFISHSSEDEKIAKWLRRKLEGYHIPTTIQKEYHAPKKLKPIFLYQTDLAGNKLRGALNGELSDSQFLIVICSPSAAKSDYVNGEVQHFINSGRYDKIIPFIIDGTPFASLKGDAENECFPPALVALKGTEKELRGVDLREEQKHRGSKRAAVIDVIATMLGVRMDVLWDRYKKRRIRQYAIAASLALLLLLSGIFVWDYNRPTYRYFADYVDKWGVPEGVIELTKEQQRHRYRMYQFEYRRIPFGGKNAYSWRVTTVKYINSHGIVYPHQHTEMLDRFSIQEMFYNKTTGHIAKISYKDEHGRVRVNYLFSDLGSKRAMKVDFGSAHEQQGDGFLSSSSNNLKNMTMSMMGQQSMTFMSNIKRYVYERDENGFIVKVTYRKNNDDDILVSLACDADGIYGVEKVLDHFGRCIKLIYLDKNNHPTCTRKGIASKEYEYDMYGNICRTKYLDIKGELTFNEQMWAMGECLANEDGNCYLQRYYDSSAQLSPSIYGRTQERIFYDNEGNPIKTQCLNAQGELCYDNNGVAQSIMKYNNRGLMIYQEALDIDGNSCCDNITGTAAYSVKYDKLNRPVLTSFYGVNGLKVNSKKGYSQMLVSYDENNNIATCAHLDVNGEYCVNRENGTVRLVGEYDENDYLVKISYYGTNNELCVVGNGAVEIRKNLPNGNVEEVYFLNQNNERFININGFNKMKIAYNTSGLITEIRYYDNEDKLCMNKEGYAIIRNHYEDTDNGMKCTQSIYDTNNKPCMHPVMLSAKTEFEYDVYGNLICQACFDTIGSPCLNNQLCALCENSFDANSRLVQTKFYHYVDGDYVLRKNIENVAIQKNKYNERGYWIEASCYDEYEHPVITMYGCSKWQSEYDNCGRCVEMRFYIENNTLYKNNEGAAIIQWEYNSLGDLVKQIHFDEDGQLCNNTYGIAYVVYGYNIFRGIDSISFFDKNDRLTMCDHPNFNCAQVKFFYDMQGNPIASKKFDENNEEITYGL